MRRYGKYRRVALGAESAPQSFNATPLIILTACTALVIAVVKDERKLSKGR